MRYTLIFTVIIFASFFISKSMVAQKNIIFGRFSSYSKHPKCEFVKSTIVIFQNNSVLYYRNCGGDTIKLHSSIKPIKLYGKWTYLNDTVLIVKMNNSLNWKFKIISNSIIEMQTSDKFNKPKFIKE